MIARVHPLLPIAAVVAGIAVFTLMDAAMKDASLALGVYDALLARGCIGTLLTLPLWYASGAGWPRASVLKVHMTRAVIVAAMALLYFYGLTQMPMAEAIALSFVAPLIALYLAALLLGERVRRGAALASLLGLAGVAVIAFARLETGARVGSAAGIAAVLGSAVLYAINLVLQRRQAQLARPIEIALFQSALVALILAPAAPLLAHWPGGRALAVTALGAALATTALLFLSWGYARAETQVLLPIEYTAFPWSVLFGWLWFGERLAPEVVLGAGLIVVGCWLAARGAAAPAPAPSAALPAP